MPWENAARPCVRQLLFSRCSSIHLYHSITFSQKDCGRACKKLANEEREQKREKGRTALSVARSYRALSFFFPRIFCPARRFSTSSGDFGRLTSCSCVSFSIASASLECVPPLHFRRAISSSVWSIAILYPFQSFRTLLSLTFRLETRVEEILSHLCFEATAPLNPPTAPTIRDTAAEGP